MSFLGASIPHLKIWRRGGMRPLMRAPSVERVSTNYARSYKKADRLANGSRTTDHARIAHAVVLPRRHPTCPPEPNLSSRFQGRRDPRRSAYLTPRFTLKATIEPCGAATALLLFCFVLYYVSFTAFGPSLRFSKASMTQQPTTSPSTLVLVRNMSRNVSTAKISGM